MKNERGEVVTGVLVVSMVVVMIFGMFFMHGGHGGRGRGCLNENEQKQYSDTDHSKMAESVTQKDSVLAEAGRSEIADIQQGNTR